MDPQWLGPFKVAKDLGKGFYALKSMEVDTIVTKRINGMHLKIYRSEVPTPSSEDSSSCVSESHRAAVYITCYILLWSLLCNLHHRIWKFHV